MIAYRLELAKHFQCQRAASIIDRSNHWNMPPYFKNGFQMFGSAVDPADGGKTASITFMPQTENVLTDNRVKYNWKILSSGFKPALEY